MATSDGPDPSAGSDSSDSKPDDPAVHGTTTDEDGLDLAEERALFELTRRLRAGPVQLDPETEAMLRRRLSGDPEVGSNGG